MHKKIIGLFMVMLLLVVVFLMISTPVFGSQSGQFQFSTTNWLSWYNLGPQPVLNEYWSGDDDASGRISSIIVDPDNADVIYLAGAQGGVWKSENNGIHWTNLTDHLSSFLHSIS